MDSTVLEDHVDSDRQDTPLAQHDLYTAVTTDQGFALGWE